MSEWQQIETAPVGREILLGAFNEDGDWIMEIAWAGGDEFDFGDGGMTRNICPYTHWHDVAPPPFPVSFQ